MKASEISIFDSVPDFTDFDLYPHQAEAIKIISSGSSVMVSVPTASGKSLVAYYAIHRAIKNGSKAIYIAPLKALAKEKFDEMRELFGRDYRIGLSLGDYDSGPEILKGYDIIVCTSEKADSFVHHDPDFLMDIGTMVVDEIHNLGDSTRGSTLEMIITAARTVNPAIQIVALSATVSNYEELGEWMGAKVIYSDFRPVPLKKFIMHKGRIFPEDDEEEPRDGEMADVIIDSIKAGGQVLLFLNTRKRAEKFAEELSENLSDYLPMPDIDLGENDSDRYYDKLKTTMKHGVAFHHAGLSYKLREAVESSFKEGKLKLITATPTLAAGINLPARTVIVRDLTRFSDGYSSYISTMEVEQMMGRAGRPKYDREGFAYVYCSTKTAFEKGYEYFRGELEPIRSSMGQEKLMRFNILAIITTGLASDLQSVIGFLDSTLFGKQNEALDIEAAVSGVLQFLQKNDFVKETKGKYSPTSFGQLVCNLYIDPESAITLRSLLDKDYSAERSILSICMTPDMTGFYVSQNDIMEVTAFLESMDIQRYDEEAMKAAKTAMVIIDWINEVPILEISQKYDIGAGDLEGKISSADWLSFALSRLSQKFRRDMMHDFEVLNLRIKEGIGSDIIPLVAIPGIGRVRARRLYSSGLKNLAEISQASASRISSIPGFSTKLAESTISGARRLIKSGLA
ncbi:MAG: DEAD/DEAH box helicase [Thermoplasmataceae archaeon]